MAIYASVYRQSISFAATHRSFHFCLCFQKMRDNNYTVSLFRSPNCRGFKSGYALDVIEPGLPLRRNNSELSEYGRGAPNAITENNRANFQPNCSSNIFEMRQSPVRQEDLMSHMCISCRMWLVKTQHIDKLIDLQL